MKRLVATMAMALAMTAFLFAGDFISANDLEEMSITAPYEADGVQILATAEKGVDVESLDDNPREAEDGEIFNMRIKLNGSGKADYRAIQFTADGECELCVYLNSSSKTDARTLVVAKADGTQVATLVAPPDDGVAGFASCILPEAGEYIVYSKSSGINIYMLYC